MNRTLVLPEEFELKLNLAYANQDIHERWLQIGVDTVQDMINKMISIINQKYPKTRITGYRIENKNKIRETIGNRGSSSIYAGYFETEKGSVDGLFFYIPPTLDSGNDILTRQVMPSLLGIYEGMYQDMIDLHFNNRPVYIVNINETARSMQRTVKISFICAEALGFQYMDIFDRSFRDVLVDVIGEEQIGISSLNELDSLFTKNGRLSNDFFIVNDNERVLYLLSSRITTSTNPTAEIYRYLLKVLPAIYLAINKEYRVNIDDFNTFEMNSVNVLKEYIAKF